MCLKETSFTNETAMTQKHTLNAWMQLWICCFQNTFFHRNDCQDHGWERTATPMIPQNCLIYLQVFAFHISEVVKSVTMRKFVQFIGGGIALFLVERFTNFTGFCRAPATSFLPYSKNWCFQFVIVLSLHRPLSSLPWIPGGPLGPLWESLVYINVILLLLPRCCMDSYFWQFL